MTSTLFFPDWIENCQEVRVPRVGVMVRVERKSWQGEVLDIEYRWPPLPAPAADCVA